MIDRIEILQELTRRPIAMERLAAENMVARLQSPEANQMLAAISARGVNPAEVKATGPTVRMGEGGVNFLRSPDSGNRAGRHLLLNGQKKSFGPEKTET